MSVTNPPPIRVPQEFAKDRATFAYFNELHTFLRLLWERTGGGTDAIADTGDASNLMLSALPLTAALASLRDETRNLSLLSFTPDTAKIAVLSQSIADVERLVASLQSLHGKYANIASKVDANDTVLMSATSDAARYAYLEKRINDLELLSWL